MRVLLDSRLVHLFHRQRLPASLPRVGVVPVVDQPVSAARCPDLAGHIKEASATLESPSIDLAGQLSDTARGRRARAQNQWGTLAPLEVLSFTTTMRNMAGVATDHAQRPLDPKSDIAE